MNNAHKLLLYAARGLALIGLVALSFTEDMTGFWLPWSWALFTLSFLLDRYPKEQARLRHWETSGVILLIAITVADIAFLKNSVFVVVAHFLLFLQTLKLIGLKERKDSFQIGLIGFFQLLAACTLSADITQAILLILLIPVATALLFWNYAARVSEESPTGSPWPQRPLKKLYAGISLTALPMNIAMTAAVFFLFPRLTFNVRVPGFANAGHSAYTDQMNLAQSGAVSQDASVAAWMGFNSDEQRQQWNGYLRGSIQDTFDGRQWANSHEEDTARLMADHNGIFVVQPNPTKSPTLHVSLTLLNTTKNTLFTPGTPLQITAPLDALERTRGEELHWTKQLQHPLRYQMLCLAHERHDPPPDPTRLETIYRQLPKSGLTRIRALAEQVAGTGSNAERAHALEGYLRSHYRYSLNYGESGLENPIQAFLFESHAGFCLHFASALAIMLRLEGIPSRMVAGYYHGQWNTLAQQVIFREQDAHAWVEAWDGNQWITLDPSPRATIEAGEGSMQRLWSLRFRQTWDYLQYQWNRLIVEYDLYAQLRAWEKLRSRSDRVSASWSRWLSHWNHAHRSKTSNVSSSEPVTSSTESFFQRMKAWIRWPQTFFILALLLSVSFYAARYSAKNDSEVPAFYTQFLRRMAQQGLEKKPTETAEEFSHRARAKWPTLASHIRQTTQDYYRLRFGKK